MSAANCPETGRQKMIGMMYLFLTAMLAINVSKSILDAFIVVNEGLETTNATFDNKNDIMYSMLEQAKVNDVKAIPFYEASIKVKKLSTEMQAFVDSLRVEVVKLTDGEGDGKEKPFAKDRTLAEIDAKDDYTMPTNFFIGKNDVIADGQARQLKIKLSKYRDDLLKVIGSSNIVLHDKANMIKGLGDLGINTTNPVDRTDLSERAKKLLDDAIANDPYAAEWETSKFYHMPLAAAITMLSQMNNQVKNAEATILSKLYGGIGSLDFKFDTLAAKVIPKSSYIIRGGKYEADLFVAAFSTTANPKVFVGEGYDSIKGVLTGKIDSVPVVNGMGKYKIDATSVGPKKYAALIKIKNSNTGEVKSYPLRIDGSYTAEYTVAAPSACVSPTKMNMLYIGVPNPIDISVSGFASDKISASGAGIRRKGSGWVAIVKRPGKTKINVSVKDDDGNTKSMGSFPFRVAYIPAPEATIGGKSDGTIKQSVLKVQAGIRANLKNFAFDLKYRVVSFTMIVTVDGNPKSIPQTGATFNQKQKDYIKKARRGSTVIFTNIKAIGPDKRKQKINNIVFKLK